MTRWDSKNYIKLGHLAKALGIESDNEYTGADVWPMYQQGRYDEIGRYCADDVVLTRAIYKRMIFGA
jgi:predicted PolB exonuclease-like 3'-5' exonuclease